MSPRRKAAPPPKYLTWEDYLAATTGRERRAWCAMKAKKANQVRLMSGAPDVFVTTDDVLSILTRARGRCHYCGSLAVEKRPSNERGHPLPWEAVGRRIGSLSHIVSRVGGGSNSMDNLVWCCLWCNTWPNQRIPGAIDYGAIQDGTLPPVKAPKPRLTGGQVREILTAMDRLGMPRPSARVTDAWEGDVGSDEGEHPLEPPPLLDADYWAEITDPDDPDYLRGTVMRED